MGNLWTLITIVGPILLAVALLYALLRNRRHHGREEIQRTEAATHDLQERIDREDSRR